MGKIGRLVLTGVAAGLFASWIKSIVEPPLQEIGEEKFPPSPEELALYGADVVHQPTKMPPAVLAQRVAHTYCHKELTETESLKAMTYIHYGLGVVVGGIYAAVAEELPVVGWGAGIPAGAAVWALTHGSIVPALGLQGSVKKMPKSWWVWEFGSHIVFGVALELSRRALKKIIDK